MKITILTLFPEFFSGFLSTSIIKRAIAKKIVDIELVQLRDFTLDRYGRVDTPPIGGGAGLILKCQPIHDALQAIGPGHKILFSPRGSTFNQAKAHELVHLDHLILIAGHYEGIDERILDDIDEEISIGDYILTGGEIPSLALADAVIRLLDGAISESSTDEESFENGLLEYPQYTEPYDFRGRKVPAILYCGNHQAIAKWRKRESLRLTRERRPDLWSRYPLTKDDQKRLAELDQEEMTKWEQEALANGQKFLKE